ncbi:MAG: PhzF family phenazine biosynthesis protein [Geminicoccaceae bacterium]
MRYAFVTCDVFTTTRFSGNQLAVVPDAAGLDDARMQALAAEFNYSETTFVLPPEDPANLAAVRIFTPRGELAFAGHPTVGTALMLARQGRTPHGGDFVLELKAGPVPVQVRPGQGGGLTAEFAAPQRPRHDPPLAPETVAAALGLSVGDLLLDDGLPCVGTCGTPFLLVELADLATLGRAHARDFSTLPASTGGSVFLFTRNGTAEPGELRARMYAPGHGIPEDPATGSAAAALVGFLGGRAGLGDGWHRWRIRQGVEMGRPSLIEAAAHRVDGAVVEVRIGGSAVPVMEGNIEVDG